MEKLLNFMEKTSEFSNVKQINETQVSCIFADHNFIVSITPPGIEIAA